MKWLMNICCLAGMMWLMSFSAQAQQLNDTKATVQTKALYKNLMLLQGKKILFGHQDATAYGIAWKYEKNQSDIKKVTGDHPAVYGWELGHLELGDSTSIDDVRFSKIRQLILEAYARGGVNTISWHLKNPLTGSSSWDVSSGEVVKSILPGGEKHELYKIWLNRLAAFFNSLKTPSGVQVPVLFRPFHEHTGSWFWWGQKLCSREDYILLFRFTVTYLREVKKVHHLIYIYSPDFVADETAYFDRYPGDEYVDILGQDLYHRGGDETAAQYITDVQRIMGMLQQYSKAHQKLFVFSETGADQIPMKNWFTEVLYKAISAYKPVYVLVWRNAYENPVHFYAPFPGHPACSNFIKFSKLPDVVFQKKIPSMYK
ncbi:MAG: glycosyl hydrolase [Niabella sp.]